MNTKRKESKRLYRAKKQLEGVGFYVVLSRASLGPFDLIAMSSACVLLVQVKCNSWPDKVEEETILLFNKCPKCTVKQVWRYNDRKQDPQVREYT